ncbi:hypothetical protein IAD21_00769 [Abditibacteriota bacterium]|nr:hypothetical protein IAD21_00769 [Abditibacteriota bacterium]
MDDNECTTAFSGFGDVANQQINPWKKKVWVRNGRNWHAFSDEGVIDAKTGLPRVDYATERQAIKRRFDDLWQRVQKSTPTSSTADENQIIIADIAMGQFLHFEQDYFSHRQLTVDCIRNDKWLPYESFLGHFSLRYGHTPDYVGARPGLAGLMIDDSHKYIRLFVENLYGKDLAPEASHTARQSLISALVKAYFPSGSVPDLNSSKPYLNVETAAYQTDVNKALSATLHAQGFSDTWTTTLPTYLVGANEDAFYILSYDDPKMDLDVVKKRIDQLESQSLIPKLEYRPEKD